MISEKGKDARQKIMSLVKTKGTSLELWLRLRLHAHGFRYRLNLNRLPGKPDIVLPKYKYVIFVNGCFWHQHDCRFFQWPKTNQDWWIKKLSTNRKRDLELSR
ncbi:very short patch repair endonuclease [Serratia liquefaciens]|uniref:very short patch repair endonuclease n=1 Tax=Serratia liquefaciens TaxID=614 RepID=UPI0036F1A0FE